MHMNCNIYFILFYINTHCINWRLPRITRILFFPESRDADIFQLFMQFLYFRVRAKSSKNIQAKLVLSSKPKNFFLFK